jgi:hypothetical protein
MTKRAEPAARRYLSWFEPCGCCGAVAVLTGNEEYAYKRASEWAHEGHVVENLTVDEWNARLPPDSFCCPEHRATHGPPWWESVRKEKGIAEDVVPGQIGAGMYDRGGK